MGMILSRLGSRRTEEGERGDGHHIADCGLRIADSIAD
jgi:hypothetical protein